MPDLLEHMYCSQQINIPPNLPYILKQYAKAAIRTQPYDLLFWSAAYFKAKANNLPPPVKERLEYPPFESPSRLSPGFLRVLHKQLGNHEYVRVEILYDKWLGVCLVRDALDSMLKIGNIQNRVPWLKFVAIAAGHICASLGKTMVLICELLTDQPDGGAAWIPVEKFVELYRLLAALNCGPDPPQVKHVEITQETPSATTTRVSSVDIEFKEDDQVKETEENDSTKGLMVWPDIKPQEKSDHIRSPKAEDEPGASSELGVEVFDDAKGPVTELVTLFPAATNVQSEVSGYSESPSKLGMASPKVEVVEEGILSHTSLQENDDWLEVQAKNLDEAGRGSEPLDLDKLIATSSSKELGGKSASREGGKSEKGESEKSVGDEGVDISDQLGVEDRTSRLDEGQNTDIMDETSEKEVEDTNDKEEKSLEAKSKENVLERVTSSNAALVSQERTEESGLVTKQATQDSIDSEYALDETITMTNFVRTRDVGYSVVEIRKGRVGDKSVDKIDSSGAPFTTATEHRLSTESDESVKTREGPCLPYWDHVPGIGPVIPEAQVLAVVEYMQYWASKQQGMVGPRNINHLLCPPLDLPPPPEEEVSIY